MKPITILRKMAKFGDRGFPHASLACYGPGDKKATWFSLLAGLVGFVEVRNSLGEKILKPRFGSGAELLG